MRVAIIGGGIAGMAAAFELEKARAAGADVEYTLFESRERLGGSLASEISEWSCAGARAGFIFELRSRREPSFAANWV